MLNKFKMQYAKWNDDIILQNILSFKFVNQIYSEHSSFHSSLSDFKLMDYPYYNCLRLDTEGHYRQDALIDKPWYSDIAADLTRKPYVACEKLPNPTGSSRQFLSPSYFYLTGSFVQGNIPELLQESSLRRK